MHEWQPIETAPRDGSKIVIIYESNPSYQIVGWMEDAQVWNSCVNGWRFFDKQILGWMPLPSMPKKKHECVREFTIIGCKGFIKCVDNRSGGLTLIWHDGTVWPVEYCPFCGEASETGENRKC